ncbi:hypothetical protein D3C72_1209850 [compost metagenome]
MVTTLKGEHQALAVAGVANHLEGVFDGLCTANIEMHTALLAPFFFGILCNEFGKLDFGGMQILACDLRQLPKLLDHPVFKTFILVAKIHGRIPHLQVQIRYAGVVIHVAAVAAGKYLGWIDVVDSVAKRAILCFVSQQLGGIEGHGRKTPV